jgi:hypothetical protein
MHNSQIIDIGDDTFSAQLKLCDIYGGQTTPKGFKIITFPLAKKFDEGPGYDVVSYTDVGIANWVTASYDNGVVTEWNQTGARASGSLGESGIDVIVSGTVHANVGPINLSSEMFFETGEEDLLLDVTNFVSASAKNLITNHGFLIALSGSFEKDSKSYFVKRFASRNTLNANIRPQLIIKYDDTIQDNHENFEFDTSGSLYLNNFSRNSLTNLITNTAQAQVTGEDCLFLKIESGSFRKVFTGSQVPRGEGRLTGIYSSSFAVSSFEPALYDHVLATGSITFNEVWTNANETITYLSSSLKINNTKRNKIDLGEQRIIAKILNLRHRYKDSEKVRLRVFVENADKEISFKKKPYETPSEIYDSMYYRVRDSDSDDILIPFDLKATKLSNDSKAMYFDFFMNSVPKGRTYVFDFLIKINSFDVIIKDAASNFIIE